MKNINIIMYSLLLISQFLKIRIYPIIIVMIILYNFIIFLNNPYLKKYQIATIIFIIYNLLNYKLTPSNSIKNINFYKLILSFSYLTFFEYSFSKYRIIDLKNFFKMINKIMKILLILNFFQLIYLYLNLDLNFFTFIKLKTSDGAYVINFNNIYMFMGNENKNIWSSKIGILLTIIIFIEKYILDYKLNKKIIILGLIMILLILSRTGQLFIFSFLFLLAIYELNFFSKKKKISMYIISFFPFIVLLKKIYLKVFRINFSNMNDGGITRLFNWNLFRINFFKENYILGVGLGGTPNFLKKYHSILIDGHMHNVIINMFLELGIIGGVNYILILFCIMSILIRNLGKKAIMLIIPFGLVLMLQYMGYDNDVVIYFSFIILLSYSFRKEKNENIISHCYNK